MSKRGSTTAATPARSSPTKIRCATEIVCDDLSKDHFYDEQAAAAERDSYVMYLENGRTFRLKAKIMRARMMS